MPDLRKRQSASDVAESIGTTVLQPTTTLSCICRVTFIARGHRSSSHMKMKPTLRTGSGDSIAKIIGPARALFFLVALFVVATWSTSLPAQTVTLYQQNFQTTSGPNGDVYFNVASPYNGITDGTGTGASFAGSSP